MVRTSNPLRLYNQNDVYPTWQGCWRIKFQQNQITNGLQLRMFSSLPNFRCSLALCLWCSEILHLGWLYLEIEEGGRGSASLWRLWLLALGEFHYVRSGTNNLSVKFKHELPWELRIRRITGWKCTWSYIHSDFIFLMNDPQGKCFITPHLFPATIALLLWEPGPSWAMGQGNARGSHGNQGLIVYECPCNSGQVLPLT